LRRSSVGEQLVAQVEAHLHLADASLGLRVGKLEAATSEIDGREAQIQHLADPNPASPSVAHIARRPRPLRSARAFSLELGRGVEQRVELVDLQERPLRTSPWKEPGGALPHANRVAVNQLVIDGLLQDLAEQLDHRVDRGVRQRTAAALIRSPARVRDRLHQRLRPLMRLGALLRAPDRLGLVMQLVAESVD
jgi:hypothetical protein